MSDLPYEFEMKHAEYDVEGSKGHFHFVSSQWSDWRCDQNLAFKIGFSTPTEFEAFCMQLRHGGIKLNWSGG